MSVSIEELAAGWINHAKEIQNKVKNSEFDWAWEIEFNYRYDGEPAKLWELILEIHRTDTDQEVVEVLSAGPLEELLAEFGEQYIQLVEERAREDPKFAFLLGGVWRSSMDDEIWGRVQGAWDRRGWDGIPKDNCQGFEKIVPSLCDVRLKQR